MNAAKQSPQPGEGARAAKKILFQKPFPFEIQRLIEKLQRGYPLFAEMSEYEISKLLRLCDRVTYNRGQRIFKEGEKGDLFYFVLSGEVIISLGDFEAARLGQGQFFGEMGVLDDAPRNATAEAATEVVLFAISRKALESEEPALGYKIVMNLAKQLSDKIREADRLLKKRESERR